jgi:hypothetical protein
MYPFVPRSDYDPTKTGAHYEDYWRFRAVGGPAWLIAGLALILLAGVPLPAWAASAAVVLLAAVSAAAFLAFARYLAAWDELQRSIFLQACAMALAVTIVVLLANAFAAAQGLPSIPARFLPFVPLVMTPLFFRIVRSRMQ